MSLPVVQWHYFFIRFILSTYLYTEERYQKQKIKLLHLNLHLCSWKIIIKKILTNSFVSTQSLKHSHFLNHSVCICQRVTKFEHLQGEHLCLPVSLWSLQQSEERSTAITCVILVPRQDEGGNELTVLLYASAQWEYQSCNRPRSSKTASGSWKVAKDQTGILSRCSCRRWNEKFSLPQFLWDICNFYSLPIRHLLPSSPISFNFECHLPTPELNSWMYGIVLCMSS